MSTSRAAEVRSPPSAVRRNASTSPSRRAAAATPNSRNNNSTPGRSSASAARAAVARPAAPATVQRPAVDLPTTTVVDDLLAQLVALRRELHTAREGHAAAEHRAEALAVQLRTAANDLVAARSDSHRWERQATVASANVTTLDERLSALAEDHRHAVAAWRNEEALRKEVEATLVEIRVAFDRASKERNAATAELEVAQHKLAQATYHASEGIRASRRERDEQAFAADELRSQLYSNEQTQRASFELYQRRTEADIVSLQGRVDELQALVLNLEDRNAELETCLESEKTGRSAAETDRDESKKRYADAEAACAAARQAVETDSAAAVAEAKRREAECEENLQRALTKAGEISRLCEALMGQVAEREADICRLEDVNHVLAVRLKAAVADSEARSMEAEARVMLTRQNEEMEKQLRELRRVVANLMGKRGGGSAPGLHGATP